MAFNLDVPDPEYIETDEQARELLRMSIRKVEEDPGDLIGYDTETHGKTLPFKVGTRKPLDWMSDTVLLWSLSFRDRNNEGRYRRWCLQQQHFQYFAGLLEHPDAWLTAWNAKYDGHVSWNTGINIWETNVVDGLALVGLYDENRMTNSLKKCAEEYCGLKMTPYVDLFDRDIHGNKAKEFDTSLLDLPLDRVSNYASYDAYACLRTAEFLRDALKEVPISEDASLWDHFVNVELDFTEVLWRMERRGLHIDVDYLDGQVPLIDKAIAKLERDINRVAKRPLNINSTPQLVKLFFGPKKEGGMGLTPVKMTKGGNSLPQPSTDKDVMKALAETTEVATMIVDCRSLKKTRSTYITTLRDMAKHFKDGRIHPSFHQFGARTGRLSTSVPNCFDGETEILTSDGWVSFEDLAWVSFDVSNLRVAQWSKDPKRIARVGSIEFVEPTRFVEDHYRGEMIHIENQHIDLFMTPNHRCPVVNRKSEELKVWNAEDYKGDYLQLHAGLYVGTEDSVFSRADVGLLLAVQADGSWHDGGVDFGFNKKRKAVRLKKYLEELGIPYSYKEGGSAKHRFRVKKSEWVEKAREVLGEEKVLGKWVLSLTGTLMDFFCDEIFFWDGYWDKKSMYSSNNPVNTGWAQAVLALRGRRTKERVYKYRVKSGEERWNYQIDSTDRTYSLTTNAKKTKVPWDGLVYCVTVPSGFIVVRRGGKVCISGNSQNFPRPDTDDWGIRKAFIARPGYVLIVADYEQLEMRILADHSEDPAMISAIRDGKDLHSFTAAKMIPGVKYEDVVAAKKAENPTPDQKKLISIRQGCKPIGFGIMYGAGPPKISESIPISEEDVEEKLEEMGQTKINKKIKWLMKANPLLTKEQAIDKAGRHGIAADKIEAYFGVFPRVKSFIEYTQDLCRERKNVDLFGNEEPKPWGFVTTLFGRYRRLEDIDHSNRMFRGHAEREAVNTRIQGTAADIAKAAMLRVEFSPKLNKLGVWLLNQVHDELVMEVPEENAEEAAVLIRKYMEHPLGKEEALCVPIPVDLKIVARWSDAK